VTTQGGGEGLWQVAWRRFRHSKLATLCLLYVIAMTLVAMLAPLLANRRPLVVKTGTGWSFPAFGDYWVDDTDVERRLPPGKVVLMPLVAYSPNTVDIAQRLQAPSAEHRFGTDDLGRDVLSRMIHGARVSLLVGFVATAIALVVGTFFGAIAGFYGGAADWFVSRLVEVVLCFPFLFLVLAIVALFRPSVWTLMIALGLTNWTSEARYVRGELLRIRELEYAVAARASGAGDLRIIVRHLLPNALAPVLVSATFGVAYAILTESALSFLGLGVPLPRATWGSILATAEAYIEYAWWIALFPGLAIFLTVAAFNIIGDRFREAIDPRSE
jgi:peptide/nickel transport system permease protein